VPKKQKKTIKKRITLVPEEVIEVHETEFYSEIGRSDRPIEQSLRSDDLNRDDRFKTKRTQKDGEIIEET
jgi:hypothetical protein